MTKVLVMVGKGRSGSTLVDNVLGSTGGAVAVGELRHLWGWGVVEGYRCGCGDPVPECPFWREVLSRLTDVDGPRMATLTDEVVSWSRTLRLYRGRRWPALDHWTQVWSRLYAAIAEVSGADVVIDSSKIPLYPPALDMVSGVEVSALLLVRDPRAVTFSWKREKDWTDRDGGQMPRFSAPYTATSWLSRNVLSEVILRRLGAERSMVMRYEDFVADPRSAVSDVCRMVGLDVDAMPFTSSHDVELATNHAVAGNPDRVGRRHVHIAEDDAWRAQQSRLDRWVTTLMAGPLMKRYGYDFRSIR